MRKANQTFAFYLPKGADPTAEDSYFECLVRSMTPLHYNISYQTRHGDNRHVRIDYAQLFTQREKCARTRTYPYVTNGTETRDSDDPVVILYPNYKECHFRKGEAYAQDNLISLIRCFISAAETLATRHHPDTWRNVCQEVLELIEEIVYPAAQDPTAFLAKSDIVIAERQLNGEY